MVQDNRIFDHVLIVRFSAMGDVAMSVPVIYSVCRSYPDTHFTLLTKRSMEGLFVRCPENLTVVAEDLSLYRGPVGMWRLYNKIDQSRKIDAVADLHDVIRSKFIRLAGRLHGARVSYIDKGKREKHLLTRKRGKVLRPLPTSHERYTEVFRRLGLVPTVGFRSVYGDGYAPAEQFESVSRPKKAGEIWIGIAPFAAHSGKIYPIEKMEKVVEGLYGHGARLFFFGGGGAERARLHEWTEKYPGSVSMAEKRYGFALELALQSHLDLMISMDSGNMHLAALTDVPTLSIWGATHPYCGFTALNQRPELILQAEDMECRPCSVFGNKPCRYGDMRCMNAVSPADILVRVGGLLPGLGLTVKKEDKKIND